MSAINGSISRDWIKENHPDNGVFRAYWTEDGNATLENNGLPVRYELHYKDGKQHGISKGWNKDGTLKHRFTWKDGKSIGLYSRWYLNGQKSMEGNYKDGKEDGLWTYWSPDGKESTELIWKFGRPLDGVIKKWYYFTEPLDTFFDNGLGTSMWKAERYKNGLRYEFNFDNLFNGKDIVYHLMGDVKRISNYKNGELHGPFERWWPIPFKKEGPSLGPTHPGWPYGQKYLIGSYKDGKKDGKWTGWYENGQKEYEEIFRNGRKIYIKLVV